MTSVAKTAPPAAGVPRCRVFVAAPNAVIVVTPDQRALDVLDVIYEVEAGVFGRTSGEPAEVPSASCPADDGCSRQTVARATKNPP